MNSFLSNQSELIVFAVAAVLLFAAELMYFKIADRFSIIDKPNNRSSHTGNIIRGGGIIFYMALLAWFVVFTQQWKYFVLGATLVAAISFIDDIRPQHAGLRFLVHFTAMMVLFYDAGMFGWPVALCVIAAVISIGALNAFNFMDGINGITGIYALVNVATFGWIHHTVTPFSDRNLIVMVLISVVIFIYFNARKKARCFAGDIGSVTLAFIQIFLLLQLITVTQNLYWVIMFLVFGMDAVVTIVYRLKRRENIFHAHRTHLYQYLSNEWRLDHRVVAILYGVVQLILNLILIACLPHSGVVPVIASAVFVLGYLALRQRVVKSIRV